MRNLMLASVAALLLLSATGCGEGETEEQKIARISTIIQLGSSSAMSIGLVAVPDAEEAAKIAELSKKILEDNVLPLLSGDEAAIGMSLRALLELKVFDSDPKLAKAKAIILSALPLLDQFIPQNLLDTGLDKLPKDVRAYLNAFFAGVRNGASAYLGDKDGMNKWTELRVKLAK